MITLKAMAALPAMILTLTGLAMAADSDGINLLKSTGALDRELNAYDLRPALGGG